MRATTAEKANTYNGGYKDKPWISRFWEGITFTGWMRLLAKNRFRVHPTRIPMASIVGAVSAMNSTLGIVQAALYGRDIARTRIEHEPIFIIGHWRSGTTLLHELMVLDSRHTFPTTYACFSPNHYLLTHKVVPRLFPFLMPSQRPMDNMPAGWDRPQEDEFALCAMGVPSPYFTMAFPNDPPQDPEYLNLDGLAPEARERWKKSFLWFLQCVTMANPKRIVLKSPPHTGRVKTLLEIFPKAKFIHIVRDPYVLFASTVNLWKRLYKDQACQVATYEGLEERVFQTFTEMYKAFERDRGLIPASQFSEVRYEDLTANPMAQMERIYRELDLDGFEQARPAIAKFLEGQSGYKKNRYDMSPEMMDEVARRWGAFFTKYGYSTKVSQDAA